MLAFRWGYGSGIDGIAGPGDAGAFKRFANDMSALLSCVPTFNMPPRRDTVTWLIEHVAILQDLEPPGETCAS